MNVDIQQVNPFLLPSVTLYELDKLPNSSGIYFAISKASRILYVGKANSFLQRWQAHHRFDEIKKYTAVRIGWLAYTPIDDEDLSNVERACIEYFKPRLNRVSVPTGYIKVSYYITEEQDLKLDQIRIKRKRQGIKVDKSALIREAIDRLE